MQIPFSSDVEQQKDTRKEVHLNPWPPLPRLLLPHPMCQGASHCSHPRLCNSLNILYFSHFWTFVHVDASYHIPLIHTQAWQSLVSSGLGVWTPVRFWVSQCQPLPHAVLRHSVHLHYTHYSRSGLCCLVLRLLGTHSWKGENYSVYLKPNHPAFYLIRIESMYGFLSLIV